MYEKFRKEYTAIGDIRRADCFSYFDGYLEALSDLRKLEYSDAFKTDFPSSADQEKYFDVRFWVLKQLRAIAFDPEEAFSPESYNELKPKDLRGISSGHLGDPRYFEWEDENS